MGIKTNRLLTILIELLFIKFSEGFISPEDYWERFMKLTDEFDREKNF